MFKTIWMMKRKPGLSREDFVTDYETVHKVLGETVLKPTARRYVRRYLTRIDDAAAEPLFDVMTEVVFDDRAAYEQAMVGLRSDEMLADFMRIFDPNSVVQYQVEERESAL
jgi:uncharacterized protein (TIGR02118 family)